MDVKVSQATWNPTQAILCSSQMTLLLYFNSRSVFPMRNISFQYFQSSWEYTLRTMWEKKDENQNFTLKISALQIPILLCWPILYGLTYHVCWDDENQRFRKTPLDHFLLTFQDVVFVFLLIVVRRDKMRYTFITHF